jgi:signal transduction histidine kinase
VKARRTANDAALDRSAWIFDGSRVLERPPGASRALDRIAVRLGRARVPSSAKGPDDTYLLARPVAPHPGARPVGAVVVTRSGEGLETLQHQVLLGSAAIALLIFLAGAVAIREALDGALRPVAEMTERAEEWSAHDLDRRFALGVARDEITGLAATLDRMLGRIASSRRHEQRFASEVAHELRTPIAGLRGRAELALGATGPDADSERTNALRSVIDQVDRVQVAVDTLLAEARRDLDGEGGVTDVAEVLGDFPDIEVALPPRLPPVEGEPALLRRMLAPLIENARRHARHRVWIEVTALEQTVAIAVCDDGPGVDPKLAQQIFEPGMRGSEGEGAGLGLPLARRLARTCGGEVTSVPADGGRLVISLPVRR